MMAIEYPSYLLASSPPGFELLSPNWLERKTSGGVMGDNRSDPAGEQRGRKWSLIKTSNSQDDSEKSTSRKDYEFRDERLDTTRDKELDKLRIKEWESSYNCDPEECDDIHETVETRSGGKISRKVSFADQLGQQLAEVKIASEPTDVPPIFSPETIEKIEKTLDGVTVGVSQESLDGPLFNVVLLNFREPGSDLLGLHNRVESCRLALNSIEARPGRKVGGMVEAKRLTDSEGTVMLRCTTNGWKDVEDVSATYLSSVGGTDHLLFSFEFEVASSTSFLSSEVEFAICYRSTWGESFEHWDNNEGKNYKVLYCENTPHHASTPDFHMESKSTDDYNDQNFHRSTSAPSELSMWSIHDFEGELMMMQAPYW